MPGPAISNCYLGQIHLNPLLLHLDVEGFGTVRVNLQNITLTPTMMEHFTAVT